MNGTGVSVLPRELREITTEQNLIRDKEIALKNSHNHNKKNYDKNRKQWDFNVGNLVFVENGNKLN